MPLTSMNHHLISLNSINRMKRRPILINISHKGFADTQALKNGQISYTAVDVLENEPEIDSVLIKLVGIFENQNLLYVQKQSKISYMLCMENNQYSLCLFNTDIQLFKNIRKCHFQCINFELCYQKLMDKILFSFVLLTQ